jgi:hypothetical protein
LPFLHDAVRPRLFLEAAIADEQWNRLRKECTAHASTLGTHAGRAGHGPDQALAWPASAWPWAWT